MAARIEVIDFINAEKKTDPPPTLEEVTNNALRIVEIYSKREADEITLHNDLLDLVSSCKMAERGGAKKYVIGDYEIAIIMLLDSATDWQIYLPETEVKRYEGVRLDIIENLAGYIRQLYTHSIKKDAKKQLKEALSDTELIKIFQGNTDTLEEFLRYCENENVDSRKAAEAARLAKLKVILKQHVNSRLYKVLKRHGYVNCTYKHWNNNTT